MRRYRGPQPSDEKPVGGGSYTKGELGNEAFNFLPLNGEVLGYFQPQLQPLAVRLEHPSTIALGRIEARFKGEELKGVLAVFVATDPKRGGQRIVGWFREATVYRHAQPSSAKERNRFSYFLKARAENAFLVPETRRAFKIPGGKGAFGQANVCYPLDSNRHPKGAGWIEEALNYIASYDLENIAQEPDSEADPDIEVTLGSTIERAAGFQSNPRIRRAIEEYAMRWAEKRLKELLGQKPTDTHKTKSYDFLCNVSDTELFVEVKGTQDNGNSVSLTPKEVEHARKHQNSALFIVHSVKVEGKRNPIVSGGKEIFLHPWDISTGTLKPRGYVFTLGKAQGE
jgi:hypothetical protein